MREMIIVASDTILIVLLLLTLIIKKKRKYFVPQKIICSSFFVILGTFLAWAENHTEAYTFLIPGFFLCFLGDVAMGLYNRKRNKKYFLAGVVLFLLGHIAFILSACKESSIRIYDFILPVAAVILIGYIIRKKEMSLGSLKPYCLLYTFFVVLMCVKNLGLMIQFPSVRTTLLGIGALLFLISDYLILYLYFARKRRWPTHGINLATYYYGILCMVMSLLF